MSNIIPFPKKEENVRQYAFNINKDNYLLVYYEDKNIVSYAKVEVSGDEFVTHSLSKEENQKLFDETFNFFFLQVEDESFKEDQMPYALLVCFDFEGSRYGAYYLDEEDAEGEPMLIFEIVDKNVKKIENPFQIRRVINHFEETYRVEWYN